MTKIPARGTTIAFSTDGFTNETAVAQVISITGPGLSLDTEDATDHDSPGGWEEVLATILRSGEITLEIHYDPTDPSHDAAAGLRSHFEARTVLDIRITAPDAGSTVTFEGKALVTGFEPSYPHDGKLTASVTFKVTGQPTLA